MGLFAKLISCLAICKFKTHCYSSCCYNCNICDSDCYKGNSQVPSRNVSSNEVNRYQKDATV